MAVRNELEQRRRDLNDVVALERAATDLTTRLDEEILEESRGTEAARVHIGQLRARLDTAVTAIQEKSGIADEIEGLEASADWHRIDIERSRALLDWEIDAAAHC
jgi:hypothetical protein